MNCEYPLGMPKGSVRAILALLVVLAPLVAIFAGIAVPEALWALVGPVIVYYFEQRRNGQ